jgi:hypothetical protein
VVLELDTYWAAAGGVDPLSLFEKYGDRITHLHVKDGPVEGGHGVINVVLGTGAMDIPPILEASPTARGSSSSTPPLTRWPSRPPASTTSRRRSECEESASSAPETSRPST